MTSPKLTIRPFPPIDWAPQGSDKFGHTRSGLRPPRQEGICISIRVVYLGPHVAAYPPGRVHRAVPSNLFNIAHTSPISVPRTVSRPRTMAFEFGNRRCRTSGRKQRLLWWPRGIGCRLYSSPATALRQAPVTERLVALPPENQGADASCRCYFNQHRRRFNQHRRRALGAALRLS
jgi:hypothetical protein